MGGIVLTGAILIGFMLVMGQHYLGDTIVIWLASADNFVALLRQIVLAALITLVIVREYFDNLILRTVWLVLAAGLVWGGVNFGLNNADYILDAMFMMSAGMCFAIAALQPAAEPIGRPEWSRHLSPAVLLSRLERRWLQHEQLLRIPAAGHIRDDSHHLTLPLHQGKLLTR